MFLNRVVIHTISVDGEKFTEEAFHEMRRVLIKLSEVGEGSLYADFDRSLVRIENGEVIKYPDLIQELYDDLSEEHKEKHKILFEELNDSYKSNT